MRRTGYVLLTAALLLTATGCENWTGGGWIYSAIGTEAKATLGFEATCEDTAFDEVAFNLMFQYRDHGITVTGADGKDRKLAFHGEFNEIVSEAGVSCENLDALFESQFGGDGFVVPYEPQPAKTGEGGLAIIWLEDSGQQGAPPKGDGIALYLDGGVFDGYYNNGFFQGGQITLHLD
jgi:hypothetical protein